MTVIARWCAIGMAAGLGIACGEAGYELEPASPDAGSSGTLECFSSNECPTGWTCSEFGVCQSPLPDADGGVLPAPEVEYELGEPVSSLRYVYVAMTELDALAKIDGTTLAVTSLSVGERPKVLAAAPGSDTVVVLDSQNGTATVVRPTSVADEKTTFATLPELNRMVIDPRGHYAVAWFDLDQAIEDAGGLDGVGQIGSFQDVTIVSLVPGQMTAVDLTVGFRPSTVEFDDAGTHAYVITEDGVSVIDLAAAVNSGPTIVAPVPISDDPFADPTSFEVAVVGTGEYAVVRRAGFAELRIVRLVGAAAGESWVIPLAAVPSDVDLAPDGSRAYAVLREASMLAIIDVPGDGQDPAGVELVDLGGVVAGSLILSRDGSRGALFTNALVREEITVVELATAGYPHHVRPLEKSIRTAAFDPTGERLLITHTKMPGDPNAAGSFDEFIDRSYGYSVFDVGAGFAKLQITPVDPGSTAFAPGDPFAYVVLDGGDAEGAVAQLQIIELITGVVRTVALGSPPDAVGVLPGAEVAFVSQRHPLGRVSFIDITTGAMRTVTGFDLNSRIID